MTTTSTDYETVCTLLASLGNHGQDVLGEGDVETVRQAVEELAASVGGQHVMALLEPDVTDDAGTALYEVDQRLTRLLANAGHPDDTEHLTRCKDLLATVRVRG